MQHVRELLNDVLSRLETLAKTKTVVGDPMELHGKTLVPLIELSLGIGGGGGEGTGEGGGTDEKGREGKGRGEGRGAGVGGGIKIMPVSVICIDQSGVSIYATGGKHGFLGKVAELMPEVLDKVREMKAKAKEKQEPNP